MVYRAKIDPSGMITFFQKLSEKDEGRMEWLSTHPMSSARADRLKAELAALPKRSPEPFTFEWKTVHDALGVQPVASSAGALDFVAAGCLTMIRVGYLS